VVRTTVSARPSAAHPFADAERTLHGSEYFAADEQRARVSCGGDRVGEQPNGGAYARSLDAGRRSRLGPVPRRGAHGKPVAQAFVPIPSEWPFRKNNRNCIGKATLHEVEVCRHLISRINGLIADFDWRSLYMVGYCEHVVRLQGVGVAARGCE
jgi:hypothetical protein